MRGGWILYPLGYLKMCELLWCYYRGKTAQDNMIKQTHKKEADKKCPPYSKKNGSELKLENRDDYFNSQLSSRLSSLLQTSTIHLPHVKHAQHFSKTTHCGRSAAYHRSCWSGRPTWFTLLDWLDKNWGNIILILMYYSFLLLSVLWK